MASRKPKVLVVCPGRGTYNKEELGYLTRHHSDQAAWINSIDTQRKQLGQTPLLQLDSEPRYHLKNHTRGDNASALIYACAYLDFMAINSDKFDVCAVTGNSMGWYIALACAGALNNDAAFNVVNTMGTLMHQQMIGGQIIYPFVDPQWQPIPDQKAWILRQMALASEQSGHPLYVSIELGGMLVIAGHDLALQQLSTQLPKVQDRFPMALYQHAAFHTPLQAPVANMGRQQLPVRLFESPTLPLIDGRGHTWFPNSTDHNALWDYTLGQQVCQTYDFTLAIQHAVKEFAPDKIIITGPGNSLGGAVAQALVAIQWYGLTSKKDFVDRQKTDPILFAMGNADQRAIVV